MNLASIKLDTTPERRGTISLKGGRLMCDGNDITPMSGTYPKGKAGRELACLDIEAMYSSRGDNVWDLHWLKAADV